MVLQADKKTRSTELKSILDISSYVSRPSFFLSLAKIIDDFLKNQGWLKSKEAGKMRLEGKDYIVKDGDILNFRFNT